MLGFMKKYHGDWLAVEHGSELGHALDNRFDMAGIPALVVLKTDGTLITTNGKQFVMSYK